MWKVRATVYMQERRKFRQVLHMITLPTLTEARRWAASLLGEEGPATVEESMRPEEKIAGIQLTIAPCSAPSQSFNTGPNIKESLPLTTNGPNAGTLSYGLS